MMSDVEAIEVGLGKEWLDRGHVGQGGGACCGLAGICAVACSVDKGAKLAAGERSGMLTCGLCRSEER
jgi:hypothetical protein